MKNRVTVTIAGQEYTLVGTEEASYTEKVAAHVDAKVEEVLSGAHVSLVDGAILAAVNIADEYFKEGEAAEHLRRQLMGELACEALLGNSSPLYARLYSEGLINKNFGYGFELYPGCALMAAGGESRDPRAVRDAVLAEGARIAREGVDEGLFRRLKKGVYGAKVRGLNSFENVCIELAQAHFAGVEYLTFPEVFDGISKADVEDCIRRWVTPERCGLAVVRPGEEA